MKHPMSNTRWQAWFYPLLCLALAAFIGPVQANVDATTDIAAGDGTAINSETCDYPLTGVSIDMDTDIVFLPSQENTQKQAIALKSSAAQNGPEFNDGRIGMVAHITSLNEVANLPTSFCMDVGNACESLLVWDSKLQAYSQVFTIDHIVDNGPTSVYLDMLIPPDLAEKIRTEVTNKPFDFQIRGSVACPMSDDAGQTRRASPVVAGVEVATVPVVAIPRTRSSTRSGGVTINNTGIVMTKGFSKNFSGGDVGVNFGVEGKLDANAPTKSLTLSATGTVGVNIFSTNLNVFEAVLASTKKKKKKFQTSITASSFGISLYKKVLGKSNRKAKIGTRNADNEGKFTIEMAISWTKSKGVTSRFMLGPVPLKVTAGAKGTVGVKGKITPDISLSKMTFNVNEMGPFVNVGGYASASVDGFVAEGGVRATLTLLEEQLALGTTMTLSDGLCVNGKLANVLKGPKGKIELYVNWKQPDTCSKRVCTPKVCVNLGWPLGKQCTPKACTTAYYPCIASKEAAKTIVNWSSQLAYNKTLSSWSQNSCDSSSSGSSGSSSSSGSSGSSSSSGSSGSSSSSGSSGSSLAWIDPGISSERGSWGREIYSFDYVDEFFVSGYNDRDDPIYVCSSSAGV
jgi:uncharacterized membrane protein YgcG